MIEINNSVDILSDVWGVAEERINVLQDWSEDMMQNIAQREMENIDGKLNDTEDRVKRSHVCLIRVREVEESKIGAIIWSLNLIWEQQPLKIFR